MLAPRIFSNSVPLCAAKLTLYSAMPARSRTAREIEIKLRITDLSELLRKIRRLHCVCKGRVFERNVLYDTPEGDFRRRGWLLRLRVETPAASKLLPAGRASAVVTSKAPIPASRSSRYKEKLEREVAVRRPQSWADTLLSLGLYPAFCYEKCRTTFRLSGLHLELDETPVGAFLELEGSPRAIDRAARALGYAARDYFRGTYWDLYAAACRRAGKPIRNMVFRAKKNR